MLGRLNLEETTFEEFNRLCSMLNLRSEETPYINTTPYKQMRKMFALISNLSQNKEGVNNFRLVYTDVVDLHEYLHAEKTIVRCVHPIGEWDIGFSEHMTMEDREDYLLELDNMRGIGRFLIRMGLKEEFIPGSINPKYTDSFIFFKSKEGLVLRQARIRKGMFDLYDFGELDNKIKSSNTPLVNSIYPAI